MFNVLRSHRWHYYKKINRPLIGYVCADWVGVRRRLVQTTNNVGRRDTTFLARYSQRRGGATAGVARVRLSLPRATASRKHEREKRSRDREIAKKQL